MYVASWRLCYSQLFELDISEDPTDGCHHSCEIIFAATDCRTMAEAKVRVLAVATHKCSTRLSSRRLLGLPASSLVPVWCSVSLFSYPRQAVFAI